MYFPLVNLQRGREALFRITGDSDLGRVLHAAGTTFTIRVVATLVAYISIIALARWMGAAEYGAFAYAFAWVYLLALPAGLGMPLASVRFLPGYSVAGAWSKVRGLLERSVSLTFGVSSVIALVAIAVVQLAGSRVPSAYHVPLLIALVGLPVIALMALGSQIGRAFGWIAAAYSPPQVLHPLLLLVFAGVLVLSGIALPARLIATASVVIAALCVIGQGIIYAHRLRPRLRNVSPEHDQRAWLRVSIPLLLIDGFGALINYSDVLMIGMFLQPAAVAYYFAAARTATLVTFFFTSISTLSGPRVAELHAQGRTRELQQLVEGIAPWIAVPATAVTIVLIAGSSLLLRLFGQGFEAAWLALILLAIGNLVTSITGPAALLLNMTGHQDTSAKVYGAAALANIALNAVLVPRLGLTGAALSTAISVSVMSSFLVVLADRKLGIRTSIISARFRTSRPQRPDSGASQ